MTESWGLGVYTSKSTIPVAEFDKVPSGVVGCENLAGGHAGLGDVGRLRLWIEEGVQFGESDLGQAHVDAELMCGEPPLISSRTCFMSSSINSFVFGSMAPNVRHRNY
jgi:hypothetical protein